jgi:hypothetical protein
METTTINDIIGTCSLEEEFLHFDVSDVQFILDELNQTNIIDVAHAQYLQQKSLFAANRLCEHLSRLVKITTYLESNISKIRNKAALDYRPDNNAKVTSDLRVYASKSCSEADALESLLAKAKGAKVLLEKKYDLLLKSHYYFKEISSAFKGISQDRTNYGEQNVW